MLILNPVERTKEKATHSPMRLDAAMTNFERRFHYPLNTEQSFRTSHGDDYLRFYRSLGAATCVAAWDEEAIVGVCAAALRDVQLPDSGTRRALYVGDLKIAEEARGRRILWRLAQTMLARHRDIDAAYGVVVDGTPATPAAYTGRAGVPHFLPIAGVRLWRLPTLVDAGATTSAVPVVAAHGETVFRWLARDRCYSLSGNPTLRSDAPVQWWMAPDGSACGRLEDTRRAKKLFLADGSELVSAHLGAFAYATPAAGERFLRDMLMRARRARFASLWVTAADSAQLPEMLQHPPAHTLTTRATIYGTGFDDAPCWNLSSSEI
jgi:hypothetical protein